MADETSPKESAAALKKRVAELEQRLAMREARESPPEGSYIVIFADGRRQILTGDNKDKLAEIYKRKIGKAVSGPLAVKSVKKVGEK